MVTENAPTLEEKTALIRVLLSLESQGPPAGVEMSVACRRFCCPLAYPTPYELHYSQLYRAACGSGLKNYCRKMHGTDRDLAAHCTVIRAAGMTVCGEDQGSVFGKVPRQDYTDSIWRDVSDAESEIVKKPVCVILNLCRTLAYLLNGIIGAQRDGSRWGLRNLPAEFTPVVRAALESYRSGVAFAAEPAQLRKFAVCLPAQIWKGEKREQRSAEIGRPLL